MVWTENYIDGAAYMRRTIYGANGRIMTTQASNYAPPEVGIHLCGQTDDGEQPTTVASYPMRHEKAVLFFEAARAVAECGSDERDFVVDLCEPDGIELDFFSNRQLWPRAIAEWNRLEAERHAA